MDAGEQPRGKALNTYKNKTILGHTQKQNSIIKYLPSIIKRQMLHIKCFTLNMRLIVTLEYNH